MCRRIHGWAALLLIAVLMPDVAQAGMPSLSLTEAAGARLNDQVLLSKWRGYLQETATVNP